MKYESTLIKQRERKFFKIFDPALIVGIVFLFIVFYYFISNTSIDVDSGKTVFDDPDGIIGETIIILIITAIFSPIVRFIRSRKDFRFKKSLIIFLIIAQIVLTLGVLIGRSISRGGFGFM